MLKMLRMLSLAALAAGLMGFGAAKADYNLVVNGDFTSYSATPGSMTVESNGATYGRLASNDSLVSIGGWSRYQSHSSGAQYLSIYNPNLDFTPMPLNNCGSNSNIAKYGGFPGNGYTGNVLSLDGDSYAWTNIYQTVHGLTVGKSYDLSFMYATGGQSGSTNVSQVHANVNWGGQLYGSWANSGFTGGTTYTTPNENMNANTPFRGWFNFTQTVVATSTDMFLGLGAYGIGVPPVVLVADIALVDPNPPPGPQPTPEPSSWALMGLGVLCVAAAARRRQLALAKVTC